MPLPWVLRDELLLTGTKYGWDRPVRACTKLADVVIRSCSTPIAALPTPRSPPRAWAAAPLQSPGWNDVPQCGYCQSGQLMSAAALLAQKPKPTDAEIDAAMSGNICRCGTYQRIRAAIKEASGQAPAKSAAAKV